MNISISREDAGYDWAVELNRGCLSIVGLWPGNDIGATKFSIKLRVTIGFTLITLGLIIPLILWLVFECDEPVMIIENLRYLSPFTITNIKFIIIYSKRGVLSPVINMIAKDWTELKTDAEKNVMIRWARINRTCNIISYICIAAAIMSFLGVPKSRASIKQMTNETGALRVLPVVAYYVFDTSQSPYFEIIYGIQSGILAIVFVCYIGVDNFFGMLVLHMCAKLENLRARFANVKESENFDRVLAAIVKDHSRLIRGVEKIEETFTMLLLVIMVYFGVIVCVLSLLIITKMAQEDHTSLSAIALILTLLNTFLQSFLYCIIGQVLVTQSERVCNAIYECKWLDLKPKEARNLILLMAKTQTPLCITAGHLMPLSLVTYCKIVKTSFGYISFLITRL